MICTEARRSSPLLLFHHYQHFFFFFFFALLWFSSVSLLEIELHFQQGNNWASLHFECVHFPWKFCGAMLSSMSKCLGASVYEANDWWQMPAKLLWRLLTHQSLGGWVLLFLSLPPCLPSSLPLKCRRAGLPGKHLWCSPWNCAKYNTLWLLPRAQDHSVAQACCKQIKRQLRRGQPESLTSDFDQQPQPAGYFLLLIHRNGFK